MVTQTHRGEKHPKGGTTVLAQESDLPQPSVFFFGINFQWHYMYPIAFLILASSNYRLLSTTSEDVFFLYIKSLFSSIQVEKKNNICVTLKPICSLHYVKQLKKFRKEDGKGGIL